jgi:proteic killer suppression protein
VIESIASEALRSFWVSGHSGAVRADWRKKVTIIMSALDAAVAPADMDKPGFKFHALGGNMAGRFAVLVSHNWRITFGWSGDSAVNVDLEDYHGN